MRRSCTPSTWTSRFRRGIERRFDLPARMLDLLFRFLHQNNGVLSQRAREREFAILTQEEVTWVESLYAQAFLD